MDRGGDCGRWQRRRTLEAKDLAGVELLEEVSVEPPGLDGEMVQLALLVALGQDVLLNGALAHQPVNVHLPCLANAMTPVLRLQEPRLHHPLSAHIDLSEGLE